MSDLISRSALMKFALNHVGGTIDCNDIARFPAEPVVRHALKPLPKKEGETE